MTARSHGRAIPSTTSARSCATALKGARIGILRQAYERANAPVDEEVVKVFERAIEDMSKAGAEVVDPAAVDLTSVQRAQGAGTCRGFKYDINEYLATRGRRRPCTRSTRSSRRGKFAAVSGIGRSSASRRPSARRRAGPDSDACKADAAYREAFGAAITKAMDAMRLDAFVYPTWSQSPRLIARDHTRQRWRQQPGSRRRPASPPSPCRWATRATTRFPPGMTFFGRAWDEARLFGLAFSYEQATHHRRPPVFESGRSSPSAR